MYAIRKIIDFPMKPNSMIWTQYAWISELCNEFIYIAIEYS